MTSSLSLGATAYAQRVDEVLAPTSDPTWRALDLFAGCGGLALGFEAAGFETVGYEMQSTYAATYNRNLSGTCSVVELSADFDFPEADVVIGGPPCQPFSVAGSQRGLSDARDGFPAFISAVRQVRPKAFVFENVRGMLYRNRWYLDEVLRELTKLDYAVDVQLLNASHHGVPQKRERLFVVGHNGNFAFPHPNEHLVTVGEALGDLALSAPEDAKWLTPSMDRYIAAYEAKSQCVRPRDLHLELPSRTVTCRNLAGATSDMLRIRLPDGRRRRVTVREAARLQSFPDWFTFEGSENDAFYQIGNAVPPLLGLAVANSLRDLLLGVRSKSGMGQTQLF